MIPDAATKVWKQLGLGDITKADLKNLKWGDLPPGTKLGELGPVFPRAEKEAIERMQKMEEDRQAQTVADAGEQAAPELTADPETNPAVVFETKLAHAHVSDCNRSPRDFRRAGGCGRLSSSQSCGSGECACF